MGLLVLLSTVTLGVNGMEGGGFDLNVKLMLSVQHAVMNMESLPKDLWYRANITVMPRYHYQLKQYIHSA